MIILGIDPGLSGALAFYSTQFHLGLKEVYDMPLLDGEINAHQLHTMIRYQQPDLAIIERSNAHPKEGVRSVWTYSAAFTTAKVIVTLQDIPLLLVSPARWKKTMGITGGPDGKEQSRAKAIEAFPTWQESFKRKRDHGRAEAALLALYALQLPTTRNFENVI